MSAKSSFAEHHLYHPLALILALFFFLATPSLYHGSLAAAQLPDVSPAWMRTIINQGAFRDSNGNQKECVFYYQAGIHAKLWRVNHNTNPQKLTIWEAYDNNLYMNEGAGRLLDYVNAGQQIKYFQNQSQVFAENCRGKAWLMMWDAEKDGTPIPNEPGMSIWTSHEFSTIKGTLPGANPSGVTSVERINPQWQSKGVIWTRPTAATFSGKNMRIMPLGDSITAGFQSTTGNGYRRAVDDTLTSNGNTVNMVGNLPNPSGNWPDNQNEGWSGYTTSQLQGKIPAAVTLRPNVILLHIGTNDAGGSTDINALPGQLGTMIDSLFTGCPDAVIIVAKIVPSGNSNTQSRVITYNSAIDGVVASRRSAGKHILVVDMFSALSTSDLQDGIHPNDEGYQKMADVWIDGIRQANANGWITIPVPVTTGGGGAGRCTTSTFWYPANGDPNNNQIANGAGYGKDLFDPIVCSDYIGGEQNVPQCTCTGSTGVLLRGNTPSCSDFSIPYPHALHMVDLSGDGRADFVYVGDIGQVKAYYSVADPGGNADKIIFADQGSLASGIGCTREQIHFADIDGDGRADYLCVRPDSSVTGYRNLPYAGKPGGINWVPYGSDIASGVGKPGAGVRFADLSGDGRADYLYVYPNGAVDAYQNQPAQGDASRPSWLPQSSNPIATGVGAKRENIHFADIDGDGRADYLATSFSGGATTWNRNMFSKDNGPNAATPVWDGQKSLLTGVGTNGVGIQFADLNGDGRADFCDVDPNTSAVRAYFNGCNTS
ncbi:MAG: hypothetical protein M1836_005441 [Candelina mexicana]|nr:MAG: hypothetical protein M1836_005441 [Candelina mexicana]